MSLLHPVIRYLAPHRCTGCGVEGAILCTWCKADVHNLLPSRCYRCQTLTIDFSVCRACRRRSDLRHVWVTGMYEGVWRKLVRQLKYERAQEAASVMAAMIDETLPYLDEQILISFVPTATSRVRMRGYDQAQLIARHLGRIRKRPVVKTLVRHGQSRQVGAKRVERALQLAGAYRILRPDVIRGCRVLLIDDVLTTGATLEAAAKTLRAAGVKPVDAAVFAQKL